MKSRVWAALAAMLATGGPHMGHDFGFRGPKEPKQKSRMPLTDDETEMLASLSGKEKKLYVKQLKEKYK